MNRIATLITCRNRKAQTLACLAALFKNTLPDGYSLEVFLVDDGSTDDTEQAVRGHYPWVNIIMGDGYLFWNGGMRVAFAAAMEKGFDYYLWLNDDTLLYPTALDTLITTSRDLLVQQGRIAIVVGSTHDGNDGGLTYGGVHRPHKWKATTFSLTAPRDEPVECETMNGNCVLVPGQVAKAVGNLEPRFVHSMGDMDYGLRARMAGFSVWIAPGFAGTCSNNAATGSFNDRNLTVSTRIRKMMGPKGLPLSSWRVFTQRHAGIFWPLFWLWPYAKIMFKGLVRK